MTLLLDLLAALALLAWSAHLMRAGMAQLCGTRLRRLLLRGGRSAWASTLHGALLTLALPSSRMAASQLSGLAARGLLSPAATLAALAGGEFGIAVFAWLAWQGPAWVCALLLLLGALCCARPEGAHAQARALGTALIGAGLLLLATHLLVNAAQPLFEGRVLHELMDSVAGDALLMFTAGVALTWGMGSALPPLLLVAVTVQYGGVAWPTVCALLLGVNAGSLLSGAIGVQQSMDPRDPHRPTALEHVLCRAVGLCVALALLACWPAVARLVLGSGAGVLLLNMAIGLLAALLVPLGLGAALVRLGQRLPQARAASPDAPRLLHLDPQALSNPSLALTNALRATAQQSDALETLLAGLVQSLRDGTDDQLDALRALERDVHQQHRDIKAYLTAIDRGGLDADAKQRWSEILNFTINVAQASDVLKNLLHALDERLWKAQRSLTPQCVDSLEVLIRELLASQRLASAVLLYQRRADAEALLRGKAALRGAALDDARRHLQHLGQASGQGRDTSSLYLDLLSGLRRVNTLVCAQAYLLTTQNAHASAKANASAGEGGIAPKPSSLEPRGLRAREAASNHP